jgi:hypothetical protein
MSALETQVGGKHYKQFKIQPVEFIHINGLGYIVGNIIKYVCRYKFKNGVEDLRKARHYIDMLIEQEVKEDSLARNRSVGADDGNHD